METRSAYSKVLDEEKLPIEVLISGDVEEALKTYTSLKEKDKDDPHVNEDNINSMGYRFMGEDKVDIAKDIFEVNMKLYPESSNVYDSYAEACMKLGETALAIEYYQKSIDLDPNNENAKYHIKRMQEGE